MLASEALVQGQAYIISSINVDPSELITANQKYSLVPQVVVYDGTTEYVGSVTKFTGCHNGKLYDESVQVGNCFLGGLATTTSDGLMSAADKAKLDEIDTSSLIKYKNFGNSVYGADLTANQGAGVVMKDESTGTNWNIHMHGDQLRLWNGSTEKVLLESGSTVNYANSSGSSNYANRVWTQSHNGSWYINSNWNGTYFVTNARENGGSELPISVGNADTVDGYHADALISTILNRMYPVNSIYFSASATNPYYTFGFGSWELVGTKLAVSEHVFGNGYGLGMHSVDGNGNTFLGVMTGGFSYENVRGPIGLALGASTSTQQANGNYRSIGVATKADLGSNLHYSGLVVDTATIYSWKRTG